MTKATATAIKGYYDWCVIESLLYPHHNAISGYRVCQHLDIVVVKEHHLRGDRGSSINRIKHRIKDETVEIGITTRDLFIIMNNYLHCATRTLS